MWEVFFIPAKKIKRCGKNIEREIPAGFKKCFVKVYFKTFDGLLFDGMLEKKRLSLQVKFLF